MIIIIIILLFLLSIKVFIDSFHLNLFWQAKQYRLVGTANAPVAEETREIIVSAKSQHAEVLTVRNWLNEYQRFTVKVSMREQDATVLIDAPKILGVPALMQRSLQLNFFAHKEPSTCNVRVVLINDSTGEYLYHNLIFKVVNTEEQELVAMQTALRQRVSQQITIRNPLSQPVVVERAEYSSSDSGLFVQTPVTIAAQSQSQLTLQYRPLTVAQTHEELLTLKTDLLGNFLYRVEVTATHSNSTGGTNFPSSATVSNLASDDGQAESPATDSLQFNARLGSLQRQTFRFVSFLPRETDYEVSLQSESSAPSTEAVTAASKKDPTMKHSAAIALPTTTSDFIIVSRRVQARAALPGGEGVPVSVEVIYEPASLATHKDRLIISAVPVAGSQQTAEYSCELVGRASPPKPQGPVLIQASKPAAIRFKNVFNDTRAFSYYVDNPQFVLSRRSEQLARKAEASINVSYVPKPGGDGQTVLGKLVIAVQKDKPTDADSWIYYLQAQP